MGPHCELNLIFGSKAHTPVCLRFTFLLFFFTKVFIQGNADECARVLRTILEQRRLCPLISPFFTPNAAPGRLVFLYQDVVTSLDLSSTDVIFMLLTKVSEGSRGKLNSHHGPIRFEYPTHYPRLSVPAV